MEARLNNGPKLIIVYSSTSFNPLKNLARLTLRMYPVALFCSVCFVSY